jgi:hypothetical protein
MLGHNSCMYIPLDVVMARVFVLHGVIRLCMVFQFVAASCPWCTSCWRPMLAMLALMVLLLLWCEVPHMGTLYCRVVDVFELYSESSCKPAACVATACALSLVPDNCHNACETNNSTKSVASPCCQPGAAILPLDHLQDTTSIQRTSNQQRPAHAMRHGASLQQ